MGEWIDRLAIQACGKSCAAAPYQKCLRKLAPTQIFCCRVASVITDRSIDLLNACTPCEGVHASTLHKRQQLSHDLCCAPRGHDRRRVGLAANEQAMPAAQQNRTTYSACSVHAHASCVAVAPPCYLVNTHTSANPNTRSRASQSPSCCHSPGRPTVRPHWVQRAGTTVNEP